MDSSSYRAWSGYAYEQICLYHVQQIKEALSIAGIFTQTFSWKSQKSEKGAQIDLIIDRKDHVINLCEIKFSIGQYTITKSYDAQLKQKISTFRNETNTKKALFLTMITTYGLKKNNHALNLVQNEITMDELFR